MSIRKRNYRHGVTCDDCHRSINYGDEYVEQGSLKLHLNCANESGHIPSHNRDDNDDDRSSSFDPSPSFGGGFDSGFGGFDSGDFGGGDFGGGGGGGDC